jgi:membrane protein implicated in regulation of membrane protease activity
MEPSHGFGVAGLLAAKIICCGALVLAATGAVSFAGIAGWLFGSGLLWLAAAVLAVVGIALWRRSARPSGNDVRKDAIAHPLHRLHK